MQLSLAFSLFLSLMHAIIMALSLFLFPSGLGMYATVLALSLSLSSGLAMHAGVFGLSLGDSRVVSCPCIRGSHSVCLKHRDIKFDHSSPLDTDNKDESFSHYYLIK